LGAHQRGPNSIFFEINIKSFPILSIVDAQLCNASSGTHQIEQLFLCPLIGWLIKILVRFLFPLWQRIVDDVSIYVSIFTCSLVVHLKLRKFQDLYTAFLLFLTLPVTVATAERSFSKLKLIKTYLRNTMQNDRLSGLAVLSIENAEARKLDVSKIIDDFASRKARRRKF